MNPESDDAPQGKLFDRHLTGRLLSYVRPYVPQMVIGLVMLLALSGATYIQPVLTKNAVQLYITSDGAEAARLAGLLRICFFFGGFVLLSFVLRASQLYLMRWVGEHVIRDLRTEVFEKILSLPLAYFNRVPVGRLMTRVTSDMDALQTFVTQGVVGVVSSLLMLVGVMGFMLYTDIRTALLVFLTIPVMLGTMTFINRLSRKAYRAVRHRQSTLNTYLQESITGMATIQSLTREAPVHRVFEGHNHRLYEAMLQSIRVWSIYFPALSILNYVAMATILVSTGLSILDGDQAALAILFAFSMFVREFFRPIEELADKSNVFQNAMASSERIFALLDEPLGVENSNGAITVEQFRGEVTFEDVHFAYVDEQWVLKGIDFTVPPGTSLALVGATGAGKTSIISLVSRFYDVQRGRVLVDGHDVREYEQSSLRRHVGVVLQDPFIFTGTIANNIAMHNPDVTREQVIEAAKHVNAHRFIVTLPDGYDTRLGERGANLSTGQKQLLALARALVQNPDILLVLDEATANVDTETEQLIQEALHKVMQERTSIIIAHRLSTIKDVDQILVMKDGRIIERGTHRELIDDGGYYHTLYDLLSHAPGGKA